MIEPRTRRMRCRLGDRGYFLVRGKRFDFRRALRRVDRWRLFLRAQNDWYGSAMDLFVDRIADHRSGNAYETSGTSAKL